MERVTVTVADSDMRGAPGEVGSRQSSLYRGSAAFHRRHAETATRARPPVFDAPPTALTSRHCSAVGLRPSLDPGPYLGALTSRVGGWKTGRPTLLTGPAPSGMTCGFTLTIDRSRGQCERLCEAGQRAL